MTTNDEYDYLAAQLRRILPSVQDGAKPSLRLRSSTEDGEASTNWLSITPAQYFRVVDALTTEPGITYRVQPHDITTLTAPMWDACGIECPAMIGGTCRGTVAGDILRCPGWSGKYADAASEVIHGWTMESGQDEEAGNASERDAWFALFKNDDTTTFDGPMGAGVILCVTSGGYVQATRFKDTEELTRDWAKILMEYEDDEDNG